MSKDKKLVPDSPPVQIVVPQDDLKRLDEWLNFFKRLSPRVRLIRPGESDFEGLLGRAERKLREQKDIEPKFKIIGWPQAEEIAFVLLINSSLQPAEQLWEIRGTYLFCFGDRAFSPDHFEWDGDAEEDEGDSESFSLNGYAEDMISWNYITRLVVGKITDLQKQVPKMKIESR